MQVMPGLLLCFVLRYDAYKRAQALTQPPILHMIPRIQKVTYFHCSLIGYVLGELFSL